MFGEELHIRYLEKLLKDYLDSIDEQPNKITSVIKEPKWYDEFQRLEKSLCDAFLLYDDGSFTPLELKRSKKGYLKGYKQIQQGYDYGIQVLNRPHIRPGKIVYYNDPFLFDKVKIPQRYREFSLK